MSDTDILHALADRQAITDLIHRYCRAVDRLDRELGYTVWHEGGEADFGSLYRGTGRGWIDFTCEVHEKKVLAHSHQISNVLIELNGDHAASEAYLAAAVRMLDAGKLKQFMVWGRYVDRWSRRNGRWGIDKRVWIDDFSEVRDTVAAGAETGRRDRTDASYAVFNVA